MLLRTLVSAITVLGAGTLVAGSAVVPASASAGTYSYARTYVKGQVSHYTYTEDESVAGAPEPELTAVARLKTYVRDGIGGEQVKWFELSSGSENLNAEARAFPPYDVSLDPRDSESLTPPNTQTAPDLQAPVTDVDTFYVALSAGTGIGGLHEPGQSVVDPTLLHGNFSTATKPVGQDLLQLTTTLTGLTGQRATFTSSFQPPPGGGLSLTAPFMDSPVCGSVPNNFEQVSAEQTGGFQALWGCEQFTATIVVSRASGQILSVQMSNLVQLDFTVCQDEALTECGTTGPLTIQRSITYSRN